MIRVHKTPPHRNDKPINWQTLQNRTWTILWSSSDRHTSHDHRV